MSGERPPGITGLNYTPAIDTGTLTRSLMSTPGPICIEEKKIDELTPIALYMAKEMNANSTGDDAVKIRELNAYSVTNCINEFQSLPLWKQLLGLGITPEQCINREISYSVAALLIWAEKVGQNASWDHKPIISSRFNSRNSGGDQH